MNDTPWNDAGATTPPEPAPARPARQKRKPKAEAAPKVRKAHANKAASTDFGAVNEAPKVRKPREPKAEKAVTNTVRIDIKQYASMTCGLDASVFVKVHGLLAALGKGARNKVLGELTKVLG